MKDEWKNNIGDLLSQKGCFRVKYLNEHLREYCNEYVAYLNEFNNVSAKLSNFTEIGGERFEMSLSVSINNLDFHVNPFILGCQFNKDGALILKYSTSFDFSKEIKSIREKSSKDESYIFKEEIVDETEKTEKGFILQLFNQRLAKYFDKLYKS